MRALSWELVGQLVLLSGWAAFMVAFVKSIKKGGGGES